MQVFFGSFGKISLHFSPFLEEILCFRSLKMRINCQSIHIKFDNVHFTTDLDTNRHVWYNCWAWIKEQKSQPQEIRLSSQTCCCQKSIRQCSKKVSITTERQHLQQIIFANWRTYSKLMYGIYHIKILWLELYAEIFIRCANFLWFSVRNPFPD